MKIGPLDFLEKPPLMIAAALERPGKARFALRTPPSVEPLRPLHPEWAGAI